MRTRQIGLFEQKTRTGKKPGRKKVLPVYIRSHLPRETVDGKKPLHVTIRLNDGLPSLQTKVLFKCFKNAVKEARARGLRICHFSLLRNHGHFIVEARSKKQLESLMKILTIRLSLRIRTLTTIKEGMSVFRDRYHLHVLKTLSEVKYALRYVLLNEQKHRQGNLRKIRSVLISPYSSAAFFTAWSKLVKVNFDRILSHTIPEDLSDIQNALAPADTWALRRGWMRAVAS